MVFQKKVLACMLVLLLMISLFVPLDSAFAENTTTHRIGGADRFETSALTALEAFPGGAQTVIIARGDDAGHYADALTGSFLAGVLNAPILLTRPDSLPAQIASAIADLNATSAVILGGNQAVGINVHNTLATLVDHVTRIEGEDRYATAAAILNYARSRGHQVNKAFVVGGMAPADSLTAGPKAFQSKTPILLTRQNSLPDVTRAALQSAGITSVTVVGGSSVVGPMVITQLEELIAKENIKVVQGISRYDTSVEFAKSEFSTSSDFLLVNGASLVDAIGAAVFGRPVLYTYHDRLPTTVESYINIKFPSDIIIMGGVAAVSGLIEGKWANSTYPYTNTLILGLDNYPLNDTVMIVSYNNTTYESSIISVSRDTYISFQEWAPKQSGLCHLAFASYYGSKAGKDMHNGAILTVRTIERLLTIPIHHYATITFEGFVELVDLIGGVEIDVHPDFEKHGILPFSGLQALNGNQALKYSRHRDPRIIEPDSDSSDGDRIRRNQRMLKAIFSQCKTLSSIELLDVFDALDEKLYTSMDDWDLLTLANIFYYKNPEDMISVVLPGEGKFVFQSKLNKWVWYVISNIQDTDEILQGMGFK